MEISEKTSAERRIGQGVGKLKMKQKINNFQLDQQITVYGTKSEVRWGLDRATECKTPDFALDFWRRDHVFEDK